MKNILAFDVILVAKQTHSMSALVLRIQRTKTTSAPWLHIERFDSESDFNCHEKSFRRSCPFTRYSLSVDGILNSSGIDSLLKKTTVLCWDMYWGQR